MADFYHEKHERHEKTLPFAVDVAGTRRFIFPAGAGGLIW
jgi:hypothetical protein